jgi:hypothetical protein
MTFIRTLPSQEIDAGIDAGRVVTEVEAAGEAATEGSKSNL